jgi:hypothetical protein
VASVNATTRCHHLSFPARRPAAYLLDALAGCTYWMHLLHAPTPRTARVLAVGAARGGGAGLPRALRAGAAPRSRRTCWSRRRPRSARARAAVRGPSLEAFTGLASHPPEARGLNTTSQPFAVRSSEALPMAFSLPCPLPCFLPCFHGGPRRAAGGRRAARITDYVDACMI